jgi:tetratricopeptide (TPR) repeat protein
MNQPAVYISCVSPEFRQTRSRVAAILTRLGYTPVIQEIFGTEPGDLRQVLRDKIDACEGLIQIIGQGYGAEPPTVDAEYGRVSYTQFEFLYARSQKKKTWLLFAGEACARDTPLERLDLPSDPAHPDPAGYQTERRSLQLAYCAQRQKDGHLYYESTSDTDLELKVERLRNELAELGRAFKLWQKKVLAAFAVAFVLLALIGGSIWWFGYEQHKDIQGISEEARHITKEKIRNQLLASVERARKDTLAQAEKAQGWKERERLRQAAEKAYTGSVSRIDELSASFADIEGTERSTNVFNEMSRILAEEGVDQALAYAATQRSGILEKVKARAAAASEKNRAELLPLLKSAQLEAERNYAGEAEDLFKEILALEPDWSEPRHAFARFLIGQGEAIEPAQSNAKLQEAVQICHGTLALNPREKSPQDWATTQSNLGAALDLLGTRSGGEEGRKLLAEAVTAYRSALEVRTKADLPQAWAMTQINLGAALCDQGLRSEGAKAAELLAQAVAAYRSVLEVRTREQLPQDWAVTQDNLGNSLYEQGIRSEGVKAAELLAQAVAAHRSALEVYTREQLPQDWAGTQSNLGNALYDQGLRSEGVKATELLAQAVAAFRGALEVTTREQLPQDWAATQDNLGNALLQQGLRSEGAQGAELLAQAVAAHRSALEVRTREQLPQDWARTQGNLGLALWQQGIRSEGAKGTELLAQAVAACRSVLEVFTREQLPQDWARSQNNLGAALIQQALRSEGTQAKELLAQAVAALRSALEVYTREQLPQDWARTQTNLGNALLQQGLRSEGAKATELLAQAVVANRSALEVYTREQLPQDWARTQLSLGATLLGQGSQTAGAQGTELLAQAVAACRNALQVFTREQFPLQWVSTQHALASALGNLAFKLILNSQFAEARAGCEEAQSLVNKIGDGIKKVDRDNLIFIQVNLAHALLFQGHYDEALIIYRQNWNKPLNGKTFGVATLEDFAAFDKAGLNNPDLSRMKQALGELGSEASSP